jgi:Xylose isomerase-like TIM barrel
LVLHSGYTPENDLFKLQEHWLKKNVEFWQREIQRWADAGIVIVLENDTDRLPDLMVQLVNEVDHPFLGLCMDIGHQHMFSELDALEWVRRMGTRLFHIHLHNNDRTGDHHWSIGRGTIDFEPFYAAIMQHVPQATISLEVEDKMEVKMADLRNLFRAATELKIGISLNATMLQAHPLFQTLRELKGNPRVTVLTEIMFGIPYNLFAPFLSIYMLAFGVTDQQIGAIASLGLALQVVSAARSWTSSDAV